MNKMNKLTYGEWILENTFGEKAKSPGFFNSDVDKFKDKCWGYMMFCPKDLGWTDFVTFDPTSPPEIEQRSITTQDQYEAFTKVLTSIFDGDCLHNYFRLGPDFDIEVSEEESALCQIRHYLDKVAALVLKYGPSDGAVARTVDLRLAFIHELMNYPNLPIPRDQSTEFRNWTDQQPLLR